MTTLIPLGMRQAAQELRDRLSQIREGGSEPARKKHTEASFWSGTGSTGSSTPAAPSSS